ncbi:MAG: protein-L-isoaspartate(D-aspartate) O-methyltransferase [Gammaproteobacteria bacterium]|nr:protein-L-isoaspartate(D-aspartate) O-methyltransferase [Gammaproteobacteria bacterium]
MKRHLGIGMTSSRTRERLIKRLQENGISDPRVLDVMRNLPRHIFVDEALASRAYEDTALPIGSGQTISQPYIVARMTEVLMANQPDKVLEVGTGCGYQTAVLASLVNKVYSIERISALHSKARKNLNELRIGNAQLKLGDGYQGWPVHAPFDGILLTAAPVEVPQALLAQLADGGCLVAPVGDAGGQSLLAITRNGEHFEQQELELVSFVPMLTGTKT